MAQRGLNPLIPYQTVKRESKVGRNQEVAAWVLLVDGADQEPGCLRGRERGRRAEGQRVETLGVVLTMVQLSDP